MRGARAAAWAVALLLLCGAAGEAAGAARKRSFGFRVQSRDPQPGAPAFRRSLLRNVTMPLHGAVKDYGCAGWRQLGGAAQSRPWPPPQMPLGQPREARLPCCPIAGTSMPRCTWAPPPRSLR